MKTALLIICNLLIINELCFSQSVTLIPANPASPTKGTMNYDNINNVLQYWNGTAWIPITNAASGTGWVLNGNNIYNSNTGQVGINTSTPSTQAKLNVSGIGTYGIAPYYQAGIVADGPTTGSATGVFGKGGWRGVYGYNDGSLVATQAIGTQGTLEGGSSYTVGYGIYGSATGGGPTNYGVYGTASGASLANYGGFFDGGSTGYGMVVKNGYSGFGITSPGAMVHISGSKEVTVSLGGSNFNHQAFIAQTGGVTTANVASAVIGYSANSSLENHGLHGFAHGSINTAYNVGTFSSGTSAVSSSGSSYGVYGTASGGASNYGVYGTITGSGYAGYFAGNVTVTGTLTAGVKPFKIDDPRDPANKYLYHSSIESNEMMNIYKGHVITDANGEATATLPSYFMILNKDYEYQLTCVGQFAQAIVSEEIKNNQFKIKTDKPNVKVSWQVAGVRQDPVANAYRIVDEVEKPANEKGTYLQPEVYGVSLEKAVGYLPSSNQRNTDFGIEQTPAKSTEQIPTQEPKSTNFMLRQKIK